ncbi:MAG: hypothetical protein OXT09_12445, partial [Myxococcales bacterium]|nr:hypothetical protein [Myxococcales bacterium]
MLLSRFWYLLLAVALGGAIAAALLARGIINERSDVQLERSLARDRVVVDAMLRLEARTRLDRIAFITVDSKLGAALVQARGTSDEKRLAELNQTARTALNAHVSRLTDVAKKGQKLEPDIAFALDSKGRIVAQLGPMQANPAGSSLVTYPLAKRALQGYLRDDVWVYDRQIYRMAARPVMSGTSYAGAIIHGYKFDKSLAEMLSKSLGGATVTFFHGTNVLASHSPAEEADAPQRAEVAAVLGDVMKDAKFRDGGRSDPKELQNGGRAVFVPITGSAAAAGVGYAVSRPRSVVTTPEQLFQQVSDQDVADLPYPMLGALVVAAVLFGFLFMYIERDRHMKSLSNKTGEIASGDRDRLIITEWRGAYRKLADSINHAIDHEVERHAGQPRQARKQAAPHEILGPTPEADATPFFGFAGDNEPPSGEQPAPPTAAAPEAAPPAPAPPAAAPAAVPL